MKRAWGTRASLHHALTPKIEIRIEYAIYSLKYREEDNSQFKIWIDFSYVNYTRVSSFLNGL